MESSRRHTHPFPINRKPKNVQHINGIYVGDVDVIALSAMTLHDDENKFKDAKIFDYTRKEPIDDKHIVTWG